MKHQIHFKYKMLKPFFIIALVAMSLNACNDMNTQTSENKIEYPETKKVDTVDNYFGTEIKDGYRWLEDDMSDETGEWVKAQNKVTSGYLDKIPFRDQVKDRLEEIWNYEKYSAPFKEGNYTYFYKNDGLQNQYVLYRQQDDGTPEVFIDPNEFSEDGTISLSGIQFTYDGSLAAYSISEGGSDWRKIIVINTETKEIIEDTIIDVKFSGISWRGNTGFYFSSYDKPDGSELSAKTDQHKLYFHTLNTPQSSDVIIFGEDIKRRYVGAGLTEDERFLIVTASESTSGNELYIKDLHTHGSKLIQIVDNFDNDHYVIDNKDSRLFIVTNLNAPNTKIISVDFEKPGPENWVDFIPETEHVMSPSTGSGFFFVNYMIDALSNVKQYGPEGKLIREIELPGIGTAGGFGGKEKDAELYFSFSNYRTPGTIYRFMPESGESEVYKAPAIDFNPDDYESKQVFYSSLDGTKIPMIITYKKGIELNGKNPAILYGYGGFNISLRPYFSITTAVWLEMGGIYAVANLRGGGEYGKEWHDAGIKMKKQNVFDDFIAAAEYLISENYTSSEKLAVYGGSNGGLLVGAVMTQRPELMKVALSAVGVLDMLRYHTFTAGAGWAYDYGTSEDNQEMFEYMLNYSPLHNVKEGIEYPSTMITTGDHDDRVVPAHSFKYAAELQSKQGGNNPVLIRIETDAGHGAGTPVSKTIEQYADLFSFTLYEMGIRKLEMNKDLKKM